MRHAQRHWLNIQAEKAVEKALAHNFIIYRNGTPKFILLIIGNSWRGVESDLKFARKCALDRAASELTKAELLHREIVRRGGKV